MDNKKPYSEQTAVQQSDTAAKDDWYQRLTPADLVMCIIGTLIGLFCTCFIITGLISLTEPWDPHAFLAGLSGIGGGVAFIAAIIAIPLLSICVPPLIFRTRKTAPNHRLYIWVRVLTPIVLVAVFFTCFSITTKIHDSYRKDPVFTYKDAAFTYYTKDYGDLGKFAVITGLDDDSDVPERLELPSEIDDFPVKRVDDSAFENRTEIREVIIPESIGTIESKAFAGCTALETVQLPEKNIVLYDHAFSGCISLKTINKPESHYADETVFENCPNAPSWTQK